MTVQTRFAGSSPWAGLKVEPKPEPKPKKKTPRQIAAEKIHQVPEMEITDDKPRKVRQVGSKYDPTFERMTPGKSIKCSVDDVHRIANALRDFLRKKQLPPKVGLCFDYGDGFARVFWEKS